MRRSSLPAGNVSVNASAAPALLRCGPVAGSARLAVFALAAAALACDPNGWLLGGARRFAELDAADAARQLDVEPPWVIQVREADAGDARVPGAEVVSPDQPLPDRERAGGRRIFVVGHDDPSARRFASRLVRGGFERVFVVRGGIQAFRERIGPTANARASDRNS
jgi:rhodanese-related sulfurtransferase